MAIFSTISKYLIATTIVGGGVAGAVLGTTGSRSESEMPVVSKVVSTDNQVNHSISTGEEVRQTESRREADSISQTEGQRELGEAKIEKPSDQVVKSSESQPPELGPKVSVEAESIPKEEKGLSSEKQNIPATKKLEQEGSSSTSQGNLAKPSPRLPARRPRPHRQRPYAREEVKEQLPSVKEGDWSKKNWFLVKWDDGEEFDASSWSFEECSPKIGGEKVVFDCPWNLDSEKMIELHLSISADPELEGKQWKDVTELEFTASSKNSATLGVTFSGDSEELITLILERKVD